MLPRQVLPGGKEVFFARPTVSYLGEFSKAFNTMTAQCKERENVLKQEAQREMAAAQQDLLEHSPDAYRQHFSFGIVYVEKARSSFATAELLRQADAAMYQQKRQYKEQLPLQ